MSAAEARERKDQAAEAMARGEPARALELYAEVERLEPYDGAWPQKQGEILSRMGRRDEAVAALARASAAYGQNGFLLKAIAVCKVILGIDPSHTETQARLLELHGRHTRGRQAAGAASTGAAGADTGAGAGTDEAGTVARARMAAAAETNVPLDQLPVTEMMPGARRSTELSISPDAGDTWEIPIDDADVESAGGPVLAVGEAAQPRPGSIFEEHIPPPLEKLEREPVPRAAEEADAFDGLGELDLADLPDDESVPVASPFTDQATPASAVPRDVLRRTPLFSSLDEFRLGLLIERVKLVHLEAGEILFRQGDRGDALYVVASGGVVVRAEASDLGPARDLARLGEGAFFGEIALVTEQPRNATVVAGVPTDLLAVDRVAVMALIHTAPGALKVLLAFLRERLVQTLVETSALFSRFAPEQRPGLTARFRFLDVAKGTALIEQGKRAVGLFILLAGRAEASRDGQLLATLAPGDVCGEMSLVTRDVAVASVHARTRCFVLELPRGDFQDVIMTHPQLLEHVDQLAEQRRHLLERGDGDGAHLPVI